MSTSLSTAPKLSRRGFTTGLLSATVLSSPVLATAQQLLAPQQVPHPPSDKLVIYQIFTRLFGNQQVTNKPWGTRDENGTGKFNDITNKALQELRAFGVTHVWYTGVL